MQPGQLSESLEWYKNSQTIPHRQRYTDKGLCGYLRKGSEGHVQPGTDVILWPGEASNNVEKSAYLPPAMVSLAYKKNVTAETKFQDHIYLFFLNVSVTNRHSHH